MTTVSSASDVLASLSGTTSTTSTTSTSSSTGDSSTLGKDDFLQLLVTQLNNQNPLDPQDNSEFVAQLAQFSSVESLENLNSSVDSILGNYQSSQALQASSLVGRSVIAQASSAVVDTSSTFYGSLDVSSDATSVNVGVYDSSGELVKTIDLGSQSAGTANFTWDGTDDDGNTLDAGTYTFKAAGSVDGTSTAFSTYLPATIASVTLGTDSSDMTLNLASGDSVSLSNVQVIGQ
jgi:flagellar basal-body rod modification protein FlgD